MFVPIDLATPGSGFRSEVRTFFICEGLTHYLSGPVVDAMCRYVGGRAAGTRVVFTYIHRGMLDGSVAFYLIPLGRGQERLAEFQRAALAEAAPR